MRDAEKEREFQEWTISIEKRFFDWSWRSPSSQDVYILRNNVKSYDRTFRGLPDLCRVPDCRFPLRKDGGQERLPVIGDVCNLCYFMYHLLSPKVYWVGIHDEPRRRDGK